MDKNSHIDIIKTNLTGFNVGFLKNEQNLIIEIDQADLINACKILKTNSELDYCMLIDVCAVDYLTYGKADWTTNDATNSGYSRAVKQTIIPEADESKGNLEILIKSILPLIEQYISLDKLYSNNPVCVVITIYPSFKPMEVIS